MSDGLTRSHYTEKPANCPGAARWCQLYSSFSPVTPAADTSSVGPSSGSGRASRAHDRGPPASDRSRPARTPLQDPNESLNRSAQRMPAHE
jgi:hypothetical protein